MESEEVNVIAHLLEVEQNAALLIKDAQNDANEILSEARAKADAEYTAEFQKISARLETDYNNRVDEISKKYRKIINDYQLDLEKTGKNTRAFTALLKKTLSEL